MPAAAVPIAKAAIGAGGAAAGAGKGKHAQDAANKIAQQQLGLQQQQFGLAKQQVGYGNEAWKPAGQYYNDLLKGGQAAVQATGPYASLIGQNQAGARNAIAATTPRGGEQNLAQAQNVIQGSNNISRLYAGMQPLAAQGLGQGAGMLFGSGASFNPTANIGGALQNYLSQQQMANQGASGFGGLLYNGLQKLGNTKGLGGSGAGKGGLAGASNAPGVAGVGGFIPAV